MKLAARECVDAVLKARNTVKIGSHTFRPGEPVVYFDTVKTSTFEGAATTSYATGGRGNSQLLAWEGDKTVTFTMEDAMISPKGLAVLTGADLIQATKNQIVTAHTTETIEVKGVTVGEGDAAVTTDNAFTLAKPASADTNADIYVMLLDNNNEMSGVAMKLKDTEYETKDGVTTITHPLIKKGDIVMVDYYVDYESDAQQIEISPDKFAGYYYFEGSTLFRRQMDGVDLPAELIIPKVKIQSNFSFTLSSEGDPSTFTYTMDAFPDYLKFDRTKKVLAVIQIVDADDNYDLASAGDEDTGTVTYERYQFNQDGGDFITVAEETDDTVTDDYKYDSTSKDYPSKPAKASYTPLELD